MAKYADYLPGGEKYTGPEVEPEEVEIVEAKEQQEERETSTPEINWQKRYEDLEKFTSQQGQQMGEYRKMIDEFITTPDEPEVEVQPITSDDLFDNPEEAVRRAVDSHPAIQEARDIKKTYEERQVQEANDAFRAKHPEFEETIQKPEFVNWITQDPTRIELAQRADGYDMIAADALFSLWKVEQSAAQAAAEVTQTANVAAVSLEAGTGAEPPAPERYSRSHMLNMKTRAKQGDSEAEAYVKAHGAAYREALAQGNVRD